MKKYFPTKIWGRRTKSAQSPSAVIAPGSGCDSAASTGFPGLLQRSVFWCIYLYYSGVSIFILLYNIYIIPTRNNINTYWGPPSYALPRPYSDRTQSSFSFLHISSKSLPQTSIWQVFSHSHLSWPVKDATGYYVGYMPVKLHVSFCCVGRGKALHGQQTNLGSSSLPRELPWRA